MSLTINQSTNLTGYSEVDGKQVVFFSASIGASGSSGVQANQIVQDRKLYEENRMECREDMVDFQQYIFELEDEYFDNKGIETESTQ